MNTKRISKYKVVTLIIAVILITGSSSVGAASPRGIDNFPKGTGYALDFDGVDDYVDFGTSNNFDFGTGDFTIELWVNYKDLTGEQVLIEKLLTYVGPGWSLIKMEYNAFRFATNCCDEIDVFPPALEVNTWYHLAVVRSLGEVSFYWDGSLIGSGFNSNDASGGSNLLLGRRYSSPSNEFLYTNGYFDEVRLWNVARTQSDIVKDMHTWSVGNEDGLIGYWQLDDGSGTMVSDLTSYNNDGTMINMNPEEDWITTTAPIANLSTDKFDVTAIWGAQPSSLSDQYANGLDIADVTFLQSIGDDIVFGHNNAPYDLINTDIPQGIGERWARLWEFAVTNPVGDDEHVDLIFNLSDAGGNPDDPFSQENGYYLLGRNVGSNDPFVIIPVIGKTVSMDQVTFRAHVADLGSETTIGITTPIEGLVANNDGPTPIRQSTEFTATVTSGTGITYSWDFGDGTSGVGASTMHVYDEPGIYTATVTASNSLGEMTATTEVKINSIRVYVPVIIR